MRLQLWSMGKVLFGVSVEDGLSTSRITIPMFDRVYPQYNKHYSKYGRERFICGCNNLSSANKNNKSCMNKIASRIRWQQFNLEKV
mmetsp:Transcript_20318/g.41030  ORF Transcript_20318/g.41030 Transcript_20318/m.41030 type:complete len:86 (-) Transcript_20318:2-259(-)